MQIDFAASLSGSTAEPAAGSAEHAENNPAGAFFAQIDQAMNAGQGHDETPHEEKRNEQPASAAALALNSALAGVGLPPRQADEEAATAAPDSKGDLPLPARSTFRKDAFIPDAPGTAAPDASKREADAVKPADSSPEEAQAPPRASTPSPALDHRFMKPQTRTVIAQPFSTDKPAPEQHRPALEPQTVNSDSEWSETPENIRPTDKLQSDGAAVPGAHETAAPEESGHFAQSRHAGAANSDAGRDGQRSSPPVAAAFQDRTDRLQGSGETHAATAGEHPEFSTPVTSVHTRAALMHASPPIAKPGIAAQQPGEFILQLAERIRFQLRDGKGEIRVQLKPDSLGRLEIRAESSLNGVVARIFAESGAVKNYLESSLHLLQQALQEQGFRIDRIQVSVQDGFGSQSSAGYSGHGYDGRENGRVTAPLDYSTASPQEELAADQAAWISLNPNVRFHTIA